VAVPVSSPTMWAVVPMPLTKFWLIWLSVVLVLGLRLGALFQVIVFSFQLSLVRP
jgi:hypothetical protein